MGARKDGMRNICELLINVVSDDVPKMLTGTDQKVRGMVMTLAIRHAQSMIPPADRQALTRLVKLAEHGKPVFLLLRKVGNCKVYRRGCG